MLSCTTRVSTGILHCLWLDLIMTTFYSIQVIFEAPTHISPIFLNRRFNYPLPKPSNLSLGRILRGLMCYVFRNYCLGKPYGKLKTWQS